MLLPYALGRSYGDALSTTDTRCRHVAPDRFRSFDETTGVLEVVRPGRRSTDILRMAVHRGAVPAGDAGTNSWTVGGCIANDIHGKNHHRAGTFGRHVRSFELVRSDGARLRCSPEENAALFRATIGGLGLTGLITTAAIQLRPIESADVIVERVPFRSLDEFDAISRACDATHEYTVAWFDSFAGRDSRGIFFRGNHAPGSLSARGGIRKRQLRLPHSKLMAPFLNQLTVRGFNTAYFLANAKPKPQRLDYDPFFYPLDTIANWNAMYGSAGFLQYQCVIPESAGLEPVGEILDLAARSRLASFLTVIKKFGALASPGLLSFPRPGDDLFDLRRAQDGHVLPMLERCDDVVEAAGGSVYPAKDARMSGARFRRFFPRWEELQRQADPRFSSSFWRRVTA